MFISKPGVYPDVSHRDYHADPCPAPSLSASLAKRLLDTCPAVAFAEHPRFMPKAAGDDKKFDVGSAAHEMLLTGGREFAVLAFDDYRKDAAKEARDKAIAEGKLPILERQLADCTDMVKAATEWLKISTLASMFFDERRCLREPMIAWSEGNHWFRTLPDAIWFGADEAVIFDYKITGLDLSATTGVLGRHIADMGYDLRAGFYQRGVAAVSPKRAGRLRYVFLFQSSTPPYPVLPAVLDGEYMEIGERKAAAAVGIWKRCRHAGEWPAFPADEVAHISAPSWVKNQWFEREINDPSLPDIATERHLASQAPVEIEGGGK